MDAVDVEVEYCNKCGYFKQFEELKKYVSEKDPLVNIKGREGRRGSFEVTINGSLVHSKLQTLAYPDYDDLNNLIEHVKDGNEIKRQCKQQPITSCVVS